MQTVTNTGGGLKLRKVYIFWKFHKYRICSNYGARSNYGTRFWAPNAEVDVFGHAHTYSQNTNSLKITCGNIVTWHFITIALIL